MSKPSTKLRYRTQGDDSRGSSLSVHNTTRFNLRRDGQYLHWSAKELTALRAEAWVGTERQGINCIVKFPMAKGCLLSAAE